MTKQATNAVVVREETTQALTTYQGPIETGLEAMDAGDMIIPRLTIIQPTTEGVTSETEGKLCIDLTGDYFDKMDMVLFVFKKTRCKMPDDFDRKSKPQCKSDDFISPSPDIENPFCTTCGLKPLEPGQKKKDQKHCCEYANFTSVNGVNKAPKCKENWDMLLVDAETYMPMFWTVKSKALSPVRRMVSALNMLCSAKHISAWAMKFTVTVKQDPDTSKGRFYVPVLSSPVMLSPEDAANMAEIQKTLREVSIQADYSADPMDAPPPEPEVEEF